jgi:hypothetical protein
MSRSSLASRNEKRTLLNLIILVFSTMHLHEQRSSKRKRGRNPGRNIVHDFKNFSRNIFVVASSSTNDVGQQHFPYIYQSIDMHEEETHSHTYTYNTQARANSIPYENVRELITQHKRRQS